MKRFCFATLAAAALAVTCQQQASAWCQFGLNAGIGINFSHGGDSSFLWGACQHWDYPHAEGSYQATLPFNERCCNAPGCGGQGYGPPALPYYGFGINGGGMDPVYGGIGGPALGLNMGGPTGLDHGYDGIGALPQGAFPSAATPATPNWEGPAPNPAPSPAPSAKPSSAFPPFTGTNSWPVGYGFGNFGYGF